ncbi:MAG TPA: magnesium transporter CorA family protein [Limnochordia bacterium]|nr:magnesium transporter CorA family protein [Limnochordia bacterium]
MLRAFKTIDDKLVELNSDQLDKGAWISLIRPADEALRRTSEATRVPLEFLRAALDDEERPRLEFEDDQVLVIINIPIVRGEDPDEYDTIPLGIAITPEHIVTVCLEPNALLETLSSGRSGTLHTAKKTRFLLLILFRTASMYLRYLRQIDKKTDEIERALHQSLKNEELIRLLDLEKGLVYFTTSLRSNQIVMEKLLRSRLRRDAAGAEAVVRLYPEDEDLLEDVITENQQALEMSEVYSNILSGMMDAFASVISNNLNIVMKFLTSVTIVLALPTMVASFFGMNVAIPYQHSPHAFLGALLLSFALSSGVVFLLMRKRMF